MLVYENIISLIRFFFFFSSTSNWTLHHCDFSLLRLHGWNTYITWGETTGYPIGRSNILDGDFDENVTRPQNQTSHYRKSFTIIFRLLRVVQCGRSMLKINCCERVQSKNRNRQWNVHIRMHTLSLKISRPRYAEFSSMCWNACCTCSTIIFSLSTNDIIVLWCCLCRGRRRRRFVNSFRALRARFHFGSFVLSPFLSWKRGEITTK